MSTSFENNFVQKVQNWRNSHLIYLLQCQICQLQNIGKSETSFNTRLNNHRKNSKNKNPILARKHFQNSNHNLHEDAKFKLFEQITKTFATTRQLRLLLKRWDKLWIFKLKTLPRWFESRTKRQLEAPLLSSSVQSLVYIPLSLAVGT